MTPANAQKPRRSRRAERDAEVDLTRLPYLTRRRVAILGDCDPSTVARSPLVPVGKRGRATIYRTSDVLDWLTGRLGRESDPAPAPAPSPAPQRSSSNATAQALAKLRVLRRGAR